MQEAIISTFAWGIGGLLGNIIIFFTAYGFFMAGVVNGKRGNFLTAVLIWVLGLAWFFLWAVMVVISITNWVSAAHGVS
jgi:hypothetical protein